MVMPGLKAFLVKSLLRSTSDHRRRRTLKNRDVMRSRSVGLIYL